jgi:hypothetical protein
VVAEGASNPTVALDPRNGVYYVAWVGAGVGDGNVYVSRSSDGRTFESPVRANHIAGDAAPHEQAPAQIDAGPDGVVYLAWQNNTVVDGRRFPYSDLRFARSTDGGRTFEPAITVNDDTGGPPASHTFHDLMVGGDGTVYVSWIDGRASAAHESAMGGAHEGTATVVHASHAGDGAPGPEIRVARSTDGGRTFEPSVVVATDACPCCRTALATGPDGALYVAWRTVLEGNIRDVVSARSDDGGRTFTVATRVNADDWVFEACPHAGPSIAVGDDGRVHIAWYTGAQGAPGVYAAVSTDRGATFGGVTPVLTGEWVPPSQVKIVPVDGIGVLVAWDDRRVEATMLRTGLVGDDGALTTDGASFAGASPAVASAGNRMAVVWLDGGAVRIRTNSAGATRTSAR